MSRATAHRPWRSGYPESWRLVLLTTTLLALAALVVPATSAEAASYPRISGEGSSWAGAAWDDWVAQAATQGVTIDYTPNGSSQGRTDFANQTNAVWADSEIPFTGDASDPQDGTRPGFSYVMMPIVAGGTALMYNLPIGGQRYENLQLSLQNVADIFSGRVTQWNDPSLQANNPGVVLPAHQITVVVRSDGSGATAQFKLWMLRQYPSDYAYLASHTGGDPVHASSYFPVGTLSNFVAASGSNGVTTYTTQNQYTIDYDEYAYALGVQFPVAKIENAAGFYTLPTQYNVAVALTQTIIDDNPADPNYLSQDLSRVYPYKDPRSYPLSMYSYSLVPTQTTRVMGTAQGATLAWLHANVVCQWQQEMGSLGYSPLPMNLVLASMGQIGKIPGIDSATKSKISATQQGVSSGGSNPCGNPTFKPGDSPAHNILVDEAPFPPGCDAACQAPWRTPGAADNSGPGSSGGPGGGDSGDGTSAGTPGSAGAGGGASAGPGSGGAGPSPASCGPDTGPCAGGAAGGRADGQTELAGRDAVPVAIVAPGQYGWGPQSIGAIALVLLLVLFIAVPLYIRRSRTRKVADKSYRPPDSVPPESSS